MDEPDLFHFEIPFQFHSLRCIVFSDASFHVGKYE